MGKQDGDKQATYVKYVNGQSRQITQEEWEQSWLNWWHKVSNVQDAE